MGASTGNRWPGGIIPYAVSPNFTDVSFLNQALATLEAATNLRFVRRLSAQDAFVEVRNSAQACRSPVGRQGGRQTVGCAPFGFGVGSIVHEFLHAAGMIHEQSRSDRNNFVAIQTANIRANEDHNFARVRNSRNGPVYDFRSIMHYSGGAFSNSNGPTIVPLTPGTPLNGSNLPTALDTAWINTEYPTLGVARRSDSANGAGGFKELAVEAFRIQAGRLITAVRTASGDLKLIEWRVSPLGGVGRIADSGNAAGKATHIDIARGPTSSIFVTAVRTSSRKLRLISWSAGGAIQRLGDSGNAAGAATQIRIVALTNTRFVTACRTSKGRLLLISWRLNANGSLTRLADSGTAAGEAKSIAMVRIGNSGADHRVATTVATASGRLRLIVWNVNSSSGTITRRGDSRNAMGPGTSIATAIAPSGHVLVSCRTQTGILRVIAFSVSASGTSVTRRGDSGSLAGRIGRNALIARPYGAISPVSTAGGDLKLIKWRVSNAGQVTRNGDSGKQAGRAGLIGATALVGVRSSPLVTAVQTASGALKLISWDDLSATGELQR